jgi:FkbM family methyltransferase
LERQSVVYSFGVGDDISFDCSVIDRFGVTVHAFDPTPRSVAWVAEQDLPPHFEFHALGIADFDGEAEFQPPAHPSHLSYSIEMPSAATVARRTGSVLATVRRLATIMEMLGHQEIDLLKMDVEGAEYRVIRDLLRNGIRPRQILVEFHHGHRRHTVGETKNAIRSLNAAGYKIFSISSSGREYSLLYCRR